MAHSSLPSFDPVAVKNSEKAAAMRLVELTKAWEDGQWDKATLESIATLVADQSGERLQRRKSIESEMKNWKTKS